MSNAVIIERLSRAHTDWSEWDELIDLARSLKFEFISDEYMGKFYVSGRRLTFRELQEDQRWPAWMPPYVAALYGMKADEWEMAGGYAECFDGNPARQGAVFSPAGNDEMLGFPILEVPAGLYCFQSNSSGALFFIDKQLNVVYPNSIDRRFEVLDSLEVFTKVNIRQVVDGARWFDAYRDKIKGDLLD